MIRCPCSLTAHRSLWCPCSLISKYAIRSEELDARRANIRLCRHRKRMELREGERMFKCVVAWRTVPDIPASARSSSSLARTAK